MSNSPLVSYTKISPNRTVGRNNSIDTITPHCVVGQCAVETLGNIFADSSCDASSNYGIGYDGKVGMYCEEKDRSWCTSSSSNDNRAITIECASDAYHPYAFKDVVYNKLIELCVDICKRYNKTKLLWLGDKTKTLNYKPASNEMLLTVHRWFENKSCPGDWMYARMGDLADKVTAQLATTTPSNGTQSNTGTTTNKLYRVRKSWNDAKSQIGAYANLNNAKVACDKKGSGYFVFDENGKVVYPINAVVTSLNVGDTIKLEAGAKYTTGQAIPNWVINSTLYAREIRDDEVVFSTLKTGAITGVVDKKYIAGCEAAAKKSVTEIAREVIQGKWGNGTERFKALEAAGYDPDEVQAEVNRLL